MPSVCAVPMALRPLSIASKLTVYTVLGDREMIEAIFVLPPK